MICRACNKLEAPTGKRYCPRCQKAVAEMWQAYQDTIEHAAAVQVLGAAQTPAEAAAERVEIPWTADELGRAITLRMRLKGLETALLLIPGSAASSDRVVRMAGRWAGCVVERGTEPDTVYVTGFTPPPPLQRAEANL